MERLTERTADGILVKENHGENALRTFYQCFGGKPNANYSNCEEGYCAMEKLADYEDAEEQGLLLRLPCKVGDTIYEVSYKNKKYIICEHIVNQFVYITYRKPRIEIYCEGENGFLLSSITGQLDDGLFLNREEAEAKLKEMEGAE